MSWIERVRPLRRTRRWLARLPEPVRERSWVRRRITVGAAGALLVAALGWFTGRGPLGGSGGAAPGAHSSSPSSVAAPSGPSSPAAGPIASSVATVPRMVGWSDPAAAFSFLIPTDVSVLFGPVLSATGENASSLTGQFPDLVSAYLEAWAAGDARDPRFVAWCLLGCAATLGGTIDAWASASLRPAGTLRVFDERAQTARAGTFGVVSVCLDDSGLHAVDQSLATVPPPSPGGVTLILFALEDVALSGHWVAVAAYSSANSVVCTGGGS